MTACTHPNTTDAGLCTDCGASLTMIMTESAASAIAELMINDAHLRGLNPEKLGTLHTPDTSAVRKSLFSAEGDR